MSCDCPHCTEQSVHHQRYQALPEYPKEKIMSMKKLIPPAVLTAIGFAVFNEHVREAFTTQPNWLMIAEASIVYILIGFLTGIEVTSKMAMKKGQSYISVDPEGICGVLSGIVWPVYWSVAKPIAMIGRVTSAATKKRLTSLRAKRDAA